MVILKPPPQNCPLSLWMPPKGPFIENVIYERTLNNKRCRLICNNLMGFIVIHWNKLENPFKGAIHKPCGH